MPAAGGGPGWALAGARCSRPARSSAALEIMHALGDDDLPHKIPVEKLLRLGDPGAGWRSRSAASDAAEGYVDRAEENAGRGWACAVPTALALRARAALLLRTGGDAGGARPSWRWSPRPRPRRSAPACRRATRAAWPGRRWPRPASAAGDRRAAPGRERAGRLRLAAGARRDAAGAAQARRARRDARAGDRGGLPASAALTKRELRDRRPGHRPEDEQGDRRRAVPRARRRSSRTCATSSSSSASPRASRWRATVERDRREQGAVPCGPALPPTRTPPGCASSATRRSWTGACASSTTPRSGFAAISPVVGLYAVVFVGTAVAGPAWVWVLPVALAGQCLLLAVYAELASEFPIAGGAYQWSRRLLGGAYGWFSGWVAICAYAVANTTIAYLGAPWALALLGIEPRRTRSSSPGWCSSSSARSSGALGIDVLARVVRAGIAAEASRRVGHRDRAAARVPRAGPLDPDPHARGRGAVRRLDAAALLAALAVGGWVFIGFDACVGAAEETQGAARHVPRAIWIALLSVGALVVLNAVAVDAGPPRPGGDRGGRGHRPGHHGGRDLVRLVVGEAVRRRRAGRVPGVRDGGPGADRARRSTRWRATACCRARACCAGSTARKAPIGAIAVDRRGRVPGAAARAGLGGGRAA